MPQFKPNEEKVAVATFPVSPAGLDCTAELWLGSNLTKVATSGGIPFVSTGVDQSISLPVTMPGAEGTYPVYLDVFVAGQLVGAYQAIEDIIIAAQVLLDPNIRYMHINYWTSYSQPQDFVASSRQTITLFIGVYTSTAYKTEVVCLKDGEVKASGECSYYYQNHKATYQGVRIDNFVLPSEPGVYNVEIRTYRDGNLTGIYPQDNITVTPKAAVSDLAFQNLTYSLFSIPPVIWHYLDVECDIVNIGNQTITREVACWYHCSPLGARFGNYWMVTDRKYGHGTNDGRVTITLAPGASFHYHFTGGQLMRGQICIELRDIVGNVSEYKCANW
ncbi:hypothetical protein ES704_01625 [subsurface metagenome]|jgi:hypothetical protein